MGLTLWAIRSEVDLGQREAILERHKPVTRALEAVVLRAAEDELIDMMARVIVAHADGRSFRQDVFEGWDAPR